MDHRHHHHLYDQEYFDLIHNQLQQEYHTYLDVHEALGEQLSAPDFTALDKIVAPEPQPSYLRPVLAMAALVVIGFFINFLMTQSAQKPVAIAKVKALSGSLVYTGDRGLVRNALKEGDSLEGGTIEGMTPDAWFELEFDDGSTVMISGNSMLTFSDDGQKKLRLQEGGFSANVKPQPKDRPMLVQTRTAIFEVLGTRFSVDSEQTTATLTVSEGSVRATRLSDNLSVDVPAKHRVVASQDHELTPKRLPDSVSIWESRIERGSKEGNGEWVPAQEGETAHLRAIPYTISANIDNKIKGYFDFIGIGNPDGLKKKGNVVAKIQPISFNELFSNSNDTTRGVNKRAIQEMPALPETEKELRTIAKNFDSKKVKLLLKEDATEKIIKKTNLKNVKYISFASHAVVAGEVGKFDEPGIILTPPTTSSTIDDGLLSASEIARLDINADLVILSACNTGAGINTSTEGLTIK